jgi:hypothetical protein
MIKTFSYILYFILGISTASNQNMTPGKYPKDNIQYSEHGESLKSRIFLHN